MNLDRLLIGALLASTAVHLVVLSQNTSFSLLSPFSTKEAKIEVTYLKQPVSQKKSALNIRPILPNSEPFLKLPAKITVDNRMPLAYIDKEKMFNREKQLNLRYSF